MWHLVFLKQKGLSEFWFIQKNATLKQTTNKQTNKQTTSSNSKKVLENPEELNTRTAPEEVSQFVQKNRQQSKLTTVNQLQAPQHLFLFSWKRIQQFHLFCNTCKTPLWPKNKAIIFVPKRTCRRWRSWGWNVSVLCQHAYHSSGTQRVALEVNWYVPMLSDKVHGSITLFLHKTRIDWD